MPEKCPQCGDSGLVSFEEMDGTTTQTCGACQGSGAQRVGSQAMPEKTPEQVADELACYVYSPHHTDFKRLTIEALRAARDAAIEEAAQIAEATQYRSQGPITEYIAAAIRKLKETQP